MLRFFPEKDKNLARRILRDGMCFSVEDREAVNALRCFEELGILTSLERVYVKCSNENDPDFSTPGVGNCIGEISFHGNNEYYCPECGRPIGAIEQKQRFLEYRVSLNIDGIAQYIKNALQALASTEVVEQVSLFAFRVAIRNGYSLRVVIPNYADARNQSIGLFFAEPALYIISSPIYETVKTVLAVCRREVRAGW